MLQESEEKAILVADVVQNSLGFFVVLFCFFEVVLALLNNIVGSNRILEDILCVRHCVK